MTPDPTATPPADATTAGTAAGAHDPTAAADAATPVEPQGDGFDAAAPRETSPDDPSAAGGVVSGDAELQRQLTEHQDRYLRLAAEFDNHRRRTARERQEAGARAQADLVRHLVDALDDLGRFAHVDPATTDATTVVQGVEMVEKKLQKALAAAGLQIVDPLGQPFDPAQHEAVGTEPTTSREEDHQVARVYQLGYVFAGHLLRPARVVVKQHT
jgi:molecular chaperone GrpE